MKAAGAVLAIVGAVAGLSGCASSSASTPTPTGSAAPLIQMKTVAELTGTANWVTDHRRLHCHGAGDYADVRVGTHVAVSADDGTTLAVLTLRTGILVSGTACGFDLDGTIPGGQKFYGISIAGRPVVKYSASEMTHPSVRLG